MITVYLAGKVMGEKWDMVKGVEGAHFTASDGADHSDHAWGTGGWGYTNDHLQNLVADTFVSCLRGCDCLIAFLTDPTSHGTIAEIGYASALGMKCYMILRTGIPGADDYDADTKYIEVDGQKQACYPGTHAARMRDTYWFVSNLPNVQAFEVQRQDEARKITQVLVKAHTPPYNARLGQGQIAFGQTEYGANRSGSIWQSSVTDGVNSL